MLALELLVLPELAMAGRVERKSTSTGISRTDTGAKMLYAAGQNGFHVVRSGGRTSADIERFLRYAPRAVLAARVFGWMMKDVGAGGRLARRGH